MASLFRSAGSTTSRGQDPQGMMAMLEVYRTEAEVLKERLADGQREVASLRSRLRDADGELQVAQAATATATERLSLHAKRHGLVLEAGVERIGAERATLEDDLQRMEQLLSERDQEIARLRKEARALESQHLHGEMEIQGLQATQAHGGGSPSPLGMPASSGDLMEKFSLNPAVGPSSRELVRHGDAKAALAAKQEALAALRQRAEVAAAEAQRMEAEELAITEKVAAAERSLRDRHAAMEAQDREFLKEQELLREHNEKLRQALQMEHQDSVGIDQRAVLHQQCGMEAEGVRNEVNTIMATIPKLAETLASRGRSVCSPEVPDDPVDIRLHTYLHGLGSMGLQPPSIVCRLGPGDYILGPERVLITEQQGQLLVTSGRGRAVPLDNFVQGQASLPAGATMVAPGDRAYGGNPQRTGERPQRRSVC